MSLMERVRAVADENSARASGGSASRLSVESLREDVRAWISFEAVAAIMAENPQRARNELRTACRHALSEQKWDALSGQEKRLLTEELVDVVFGMGPIEGLIADESVTEIMVNGARSIFYERDGRLVPCELAFDSDEQVRVLGVAARRLQMGASPDEALAVMRASDQVPELSFVAVALDVQHQSGGSIAPVLETARESVVSELDLMRSMRVQTAQAKLSASIVTVMPFLLVALFSIVSPGF